MREGRDCSESLETKAELSIEKNTVAPVADEASQRSQTSGIRLTGRKGEKGSADAIASELADARDRWFRSLDKVALRSALLRLLLCLDSD